MVFTELTSPASKPAALTGPVINEFNLQIATVNGSGSQTANTVLMRALFQMGLPVSSKNLFPSNIMGQPTWFSLRVSQKGYVARAEKVDILVAMNLDSVRDDVLKLAPGATVIYDEPLRVDALRGDLIGYPVPIDRLVATVCPNARLRRLVRNMVYVGALAALLKIPLEEVEKAVQKQFRKKASASNLNFNTAQAGYDFASTHLQKIDPYSVVAMEKQPGKIIIDGNAAAALGCLFAGVSVVTWYPITPSSSLCESLTEYLSRYRRDRETGKVTFAVVQAEDELAALGMAIAAGWAGARAMTATSGPGLSLMAEFAGFAYYAEVPVVVIDVQRVGPSTGLPTRTAQSDLLFARFLSHGDTQHILLLPGSVEECYSFSVEAFDLAEELQTPIFVMMDLDLGMNNWVADDFPYPPRPMRRGKVLSAGDIERVQKFERYRDMDGDGITYRTLPGNPHPLASYFTRGTAHDEQAHYSERPEDYVRVMDRLARKYETARQRVPSPLIEKNPKARVGIIAFGSSHSAVVEGRDLLRVRHQFETSYLRVRAIPFNAEITAFVASHDRIYVVEQNRDGQMKDLLRLQLPARESDKLRSVLHYDGLPLPAEKVVEQVLFQEDSGPRRNETGNGKRQTADRNRE